MGGWEFGGFALVRFREDEEEGLWGFVSRIGKTYLIPNVSESLAIFPFNPASPFMATSPSAPFLN